MRMMWGLALQAGFHIREVTMLRFDTVAMPSAVSLAVGGSWRK